MQRRAYAQFGGLEQLTIVGNVLTAPELRRTAQTGQIVASFRVASTSRRYDRMTGDWKDGHSLRVRVTCWRRLAESLGSSVHLGDPVVVTGRLYTRDWIDESGVRRVLYEMDAVAVGHDLSRGTAKFTRHPSATATSTIEDEESERRIGGEETEPFDPSMVDGDDAAEDEDEFGEESLTSDRVLAAV
jgi:single-strand DNA-binding protein